MFIRIKKIKGKNYAYLVKNCWYKRKKYKVKQKTVKYLGKVIKTEKAKNETILENLNTDLQDYLKKQKPKRIILNLIKLELLKHNFSETKKNIFELNNIKVSLKEKRVLDKETKKLICLEINNNFLCDYTLRRLINFKPKQNLTDLQIGKQLATSFESTGILIPKEIFVKLAQKILKEIKK